MNWSLPVGRVAGTTVKVHVTFLLFLLFIGVVVYRENGPQAAWDTLAFISLIFVCVVLHEFGHILMARRFGTRTRDVTLYPIGGVASMERIPEKPIEEILVALAGPAVNLVIAFAIMLVLGAVLTGEDFATLGNAKASLAMRIAAANLVLMTFNLLPAFPMDGGRVLRALLALAFDRSRATKIAAGIGQIFAFGLGFMGLFGNPFLLLIAAFVFIAAGAEADATVLHDSARDLSVGEAMVTEFSSLQPEESIGSSIDRLIRSSDELFPVIDGEGHALGLVTRLMILEALTNHPDATPVSALMLPVEDTLAENENLEKVLDRFEASGLPALFVTDASAKVIGLLTRTSIAQAILVHTARPGWRYHRGGMLSRHIPIVSRDRPKASSSPSP